MVAQRTGIKHGGATALLAEWLPSPIGFFVVPVGKSRYLRLLFMIYMYGVTSRTSHS